MTATPAGRWLLAFRPRTLTAALAPILVGTGLAMHHGHGLQWHLSLFTLLSAGAIQIATNLFNDALDFRKGTDTGERLGPTRVTQSGLISARRVVLGGFLAAAAALAFGIPLVAAGGWPIVILGVVSLCLAYGYTGGPFPLAYLGLGDVFVVVFFGLAAVGGMYYLQSGTLQPDVILAGFQVGLLATALLAVNNLRDVEQDRRSGKKTLAVRLGVTFGRYEIAFLCLGPFALNTVWMFSGAWITALLPLVSLPLAIRLLRGVFAHEPGAIYNKFLAWTAGLHLVFSMLLAAGMICD